MKAKDVKRWEIVESRGKRYLRDRHENEGTLIEVHEEQVITEDEHFIIIYCASSDFNFKMYSSISLFDEYSEFYVYMFKKKGVVLCYTSYH